ncbi:MAG: signal peptidase I, partial [Firmicutes bacterium]|nr:signal peptidase I [Bacillota bacterium]
QPAAPAQLAAPAQFAATNPFTEWDFDELGPEAEEAPPESPSQAVPEPAAKKGKLSPKARKTLKLVQNTLFWAVCILLVAGSVLFAVSKDPRKNYLGYRIYSVKTESMTPKADGSSPPGGFRRGDLIIVKMCGPSSIKVNDIITFNPSTKEEDNQLFLTHRVVDVKTELAGKPGTYFVTKGDFNNSEDPPISAEMLIGKKVFSIPKVGSFLQKVRENFTLSIITILCFFACIFMFKWYFSSPKKKAGAAEETKPPQPPQLPRQPRAPQRYFSAVPEAAV